MLEVKRDDFDESLEDIMVSIDEILKSTKEGYEVEKEEKIKRIYKSKKCNQSYIFLFWYRWWDSNPHGCPHDFESCASTNSATSAYNLSIY